MTPSRRYFLISSTAAGPLAFAQEAPAQGRPARIPTAVIGTGNRGTHLLRGVMEQPDAQLAAVCDLKPDRLDRAASVAARDNPKTHRDWRAVLDQKDVEAVFIATPPDLHAEMAIAALQAGKHVYCEKPIGVTVRQVQDLVIAARASSKVFVVGQQRRCSPQLIEAIRKIREGAIGKVAMIKAQRHAPADLPYDGSSSDWYFNVHRSGGYLVEQSVHNLDLCNWIVGENPIRASGSGGMLVHPEEPKGRSIFDCGVICYEYASGARMSFTQNVFHPRGMPGGGQTLYVYGSTAAVDFFGGMNVYPLVGANKPAPLVPEAKEDQHIHVRTFYDCITKGAPNPAGIEVAAGATLTAILGHLAMVKRGVVDWVDLGVNL